MWLLDKLFSRPGPAPQPATEEQKAVEFSPEMMAAISGGWGVPTKSGASVSWLSAIRNPAYYRGVMVIADGVAQLPVELYRRLPSGKGSEPAFDHPLYDLLLHQASEMQDSFQFFNTILMHAVATGDSVSFRVVVNGETRELIPIRPECTGIDLETGLMRPRYDVTFENGGFATLGPEQVFHLSGPRWRPYKGLDPADIGREAIGLSQALEESQARLHSNGVRSSGMFSPKGDKTLTKDQQARLVEQIREQYQGLQNAFRPIVASGAMEFEPFMQTGVEAQTLESRKHQIEEQCRLLGVFPIMVGHAGDQSPTFASAAAFFDAHVRYSLMRWNKALRSAIETQLLTKDERREGYYIRIDTSELTRGSVEARTAYYKAALGSNSNPGWLRPNEVREDDGWNPSDEPGMDEIWQPQTMTPGGRAPDGAPSAQGRNGAAPSAADESGGEKSIAPRTLYVSRKLRNGADFIAWAKRQGFAAPLAESDLHVTIAYSRARVDWMRAGQDWESDRNGDLVVPPGGPRIVERLGSEGAIVLKFASWALARRHHEICEAGASWDYPEYQPHVTITYDGAGVDLSTVEPFRGPLIFGPEIFEELDEKKAQ
jgi:HK97 family phage portal protein